MKKSKISKVKWRWDWGCFIPLCPYCNEPAYEKDYCVFCLKDYKWVDRSKERMVIVGDYTIVQTSNNHISVTKDGRMVLHASCTKRMSKRKLKGYAKICDVLGDYEPPGKTITVPKYTYKGEDNGT